MNNKTFSGTVVICGIQQNASDPILTVNINGKTAVTIRGDGSAELHDGFNINDAAKAFWQAVTACYPHIASRLSSGLLTRTANYDEPGSWGHASEGWPWIPDPQGNFRSFVIQHEDIVPYGAYVTVGNRLRIHPQYIDSLLRALDDLPKDEG